MSNWLVLGEGLVDLMDGEEMPEEDVRELKRSQEVSGQWFDTCTVEGYDLSWSKQKRLLSNSSFHRKPVEVQKGASTSVDFFFTKEKQLTWGCYEFLPLEVYDWFIDDLLQEWGETRAYPSLADCPKPPTSLDTGSPYAPVDGDGDDYSWVGLEYTSRIVPLPYRVRRPTKLAFFLRCLHQPTGASGCGDEFFLLRDSLAIHELREMSEEEKVFLRFAIRRLFANIETGRFITQPEFRTHIPKKKVVLSDFFSNQSALTRSGAPNWDTNHSLWGGEFDVTSTRTFPYRGVVVLRAVSDLVEEAPHQTDTSLALNRPVPGTSIPQSVHLAVVGSGVPLYNPV